MSKARRPMGCIGLLGMRDLQWRRRRVAIAVGGAALVLGLTLVLAGFRAGFDAEADETLKTLDAAALYVAEGSTGPITGPVPFTPDGAVVSETRSSSLALSTLYFDKGGDDGHESTAVYAMVIGHEAGRVGTPLVSEGRPPQTRGEAVIDASTGVSIDETITLTAGEYRVVGLTDGKTLLAGAAHLYLTLEDAQHELFAGEPLVTALAVDSIPSHPPAGLTGVGPADARADMLLPLQSAIESINLEVFILWLVAGAVIGSVMYLSSIEREPDFAVLKAMGTRSSKLVGALLAQASALALAAGLAAIAIGLMIREVFPFTISYPAELLVGIIVVAVVMGCLGSLSGLRRVLRIDPSTAFA